MAISIRPYMPADLDAVATLWLTSWESTGVTAPGASGTVADLRKRLPKDIAGGKEVHVATMADEIVGFCALSGTELDQLFIAPSRQGRGLGKQLLDFVKRIRPHGFTLVTAVNSRAPAFYAREGLTRGGIEPHPRYGFAMYRYNWVSA